MTQAEVMQTLRRNPIFRRLGDLRLTVVALCGAVQRLRPGETLFDHAD